MGLFIPMGGYQTILEEVSRFKVIGMRKLYLMMSCNYSYSFFCRQVRKLEEEGLIQSITAMRKMKFLTLTRKADKFTMHKAQYTESNIELNHDLVTSNILIELNQYDTLFGGHVLHSSDSYSVEADGLIYVDKGKGAGSIAIEVELTQKSKSRIASKFVSYLNSKCFNYCLYIFNKPGVFKTYKRKLDSMKVEVQEKIILLYLPNLSINTFNYLESEVYFQKETKSFESLFKRKEGV